MYCGIQEGCIRRPHQTAFAVGAALCFPQQDNLGLNNIFLVVKTSLQLLLGEKKCWGERKEERKLDGLVRKFQGSDFSLARSYKTLAKTDACRHVPA